MNPEPKVFKSPEHASELIKTVAYTFGATLVGITRFNPDFHWQGAIRGTEGENRETTPEHWQYAIVFGVPHEWDQFFSNPVYGTTYDAYARLRQIGGKMDSFIRQLGYPCRMEIPPMDFEVTMPPLAIDAGLGEQGRIGVLISPESGGNTRLGCVLTNIPMATDKPIDFGVQEFCKSCKICAEQCRVGRSVLMMSRAKYAVTNAGLSTMTNASISGRRWLRAIRAAAACASPPAPIAARITGCTTWRALWSPRSDADQWKRPALDGQELV